MQESSFYQSENHSAAGLQVIGFNRSVQSLLLVKSQQVGVMRITEFVKHTFAQCLCQTDWVTGSKWVTTEVPVWVQIPPSREEVV